jgi:arsenate reductase
MLFICYPRCTTCAKARRWLDERGISYDFRDIKLNNPTYEELKTWTSWGDPPLRKFFNTSGQRYKSLGLSERIAVMSEDEKLRILATDGMLVKRPLLIGDGFILAGFKEAEWAERLLG